MKVIKLRFVSCLQDERSRLHRRASGLNELAMSSFVRGKIPDKLKAAVLEGSSIGLETLIQRSIIGRRRRREAAELRRGKILPPPSSVWRRNT